MYHYFLFLLSSPLFLLFFHFFFFFFFFFLKPRIDTEVVKIVKQIIVNEGEGLKLKAKQDLVDRLGVERHTGDIWIMRKHVIIIIIIINY